MTTQLNFNTMQAACELLSAEFSDGCPLSAYGISTDDLKVLGKTSFWQASDRVRVQRALSALRDGICQHIGLPNFNVPAEYMACILCKFVHSVNIRVACGWVAAMPLFPCDDIAADNLSAEPVTDRRLFALVMLARGKDPAFEAGFDSKVKKAIIKQGAQ